MMAIFNEEEIKKIHEMKTQVDIENEKETQRRTELREFTIQALKEFPVIAEKIGLKKLKRYGGDKSGWGMYYSSLNDGRYYLNDFPRDDVKIDDTEINRCAETINLYFRTVEDVRKMIIAALTGRPIAPNN